MCEETSTSASSVAGASTEELFNQDSAMNSRYLTQAFPFSSGNPRIEETRGVMHLYRNDIVSSSSDLPANKARFVQDAATQIKVERKPLLCVLGVPNHMTYADFCQFCGSFIHHMLEMRIVRNDGVEDQYSVLIRSDSQSSADSFYKHFNGKQFSSIEVEACRVFFTVDVQYTGSIEHSQSTSVSSLEQPSCPVCLERLDQDMGGILTTICNHSFHCSCISKWTDSSCPVCRYCQQQPEKSTCFVCQTSENLWMCILCGFVGCGRYKEGHAVRHWKETQHCYSLELETRRVWDYAGDNYVHRLIQSKTDGKLVELNHHCAQSDGCSSCKCGVDTELTDAHLDSKVEAIVNEYNELLTTQLESQKLYFESLHQEVEEEIERETSEAIDKALNQNKKLQKLKDKLEKCIEEKKFLDEMNDNLLRNQELWETKISEIGEREKKALVLKDEKIQELEEQLKSLMASFESENTVETESTSDESKKGVILPTESSSNSDSK